MAKRVPDETSKTRREKVLKQAEEILEVVGLTEHSQTIAKNLSYGQQRRLEIARALASQPKLLLLDEPAAGMNEKETNDLFDLIKKIQALGITVLLIEHDMPLVMRICSRIVVLNFGRKSQKVHRAVFKTIKKSLKPTSGLEEEEELA